MTHYNNAGKARADNTRQSYDFVAPAALKSGVTQHVPVVIAGGGPIGLAAAIDLARAGIKSVVLEKHNTVSTGSRAICWAKRSLEILDRLGSAERMMQKGVIWNQGKVYFGKDSEPLYSFDLLADKAQKFPAFINLQQFYGEEYLIDLFAEHPQSELRWHNEVSAVKNAGDRVTVTVQTPAGEYQITCDYLIAADGHRSPIRNMLGLDFAGRRFEDNFLIVDVKMQADFPAVRRFWFDPPFNPGQTSLIHKQADDVWRIDFQLGWDIDRAAALKQENVDRMVRAFLGTELEFDYEWVSLYTFQCRRMQNFVHKRIIFAGDSAHLVSPFGARGANGGLQDVDNLVWKLALILRGIAPQRLLQSYNHERIYGADENITNSARSTDFMTPKSAISLAFRNATLELARDFAFARRFVNPGRLSVPCTLDESPYVTPDEDRFSGKQRPGSPCLDAPIRMDGKDGWLLNQLGGRFVGLYFIGDKKPPAALYELGSAQLPLDIIIVRKDEPGKDNPVKDEPGSEGATLIDKAGLLHKHYDAEAGSFYLIRPDQHVAGRWKQFDAARAKTALARALGKTVEKTL